MNPDDPVIELIFQYKNDPPEKPKYKRLSEVEEYKNKQIAKGFKLVKEEPYSNVAAKNLANAKSEADKVTAAKQEQANRAQAALSAERSTVRKDVGNAPRSFVSGALDGLSSNWLDEAFAGAGGLDQSERMRANVKIQKSESPNAYAAGQMLGSVGQQLALTRLFPALKTPGGQLAYSGIEGAISGLGEAEDISSPEEAAAIAATSAAGGMIGQVGGTALGRVGSGALKKLVGNTGIESAKEIEERLGREMLGKQLAEMNQFKATAGQVQRNALKDFRTTVGGLSPSQAAMEFAKQIAENKKIEQELIANFEKNYPEQFSKGGAIGSSLGSEATDLQSYQNKLTQALSSGNESIDAANAALAASGPIRVPGIPTQLTPAEEQQRIVNEALDRIIELNKADAANKRKFRPSYEPNEKLSPYY